MVLLHGAIAQGLIDFYSSADPSNAAPPPFYPIDPAAYDGKCPDNSLFMPAPPLCQERHSADGRVRLQLASPAAVVELARAGARQFNQLYIDRVAQVVGWARAAGMYVIIDMHQNAYSRYVGGSSPVPLPKATP